MLLNKRNRCLLAALAILLAFSLLFSGCTLRLDQFIDNIPSSAASQPSTPSSQPSVPPSPEKVELVIKDAELTYEMTDADVNEFYDLLKQCKDAALGGQDGDTVMELSDKIDDQYYYLDGQCSIATVLFYMDMEDEAASQLYLDSDEIVTQAYDAYMEMVKELYAAEFPAKERFFEDWTEQDIASLKAYTPEVMELNQRNSEIEVAYQGMQNDEDMYTEMVPLYIEMVQNNNRIAQIYGYDNYYEYAYEMVYNRDYGAEEIRTMRTLVSQYMPEAAEGAMNNFMEAMDDLSSYQQNSLSSFLFSSYRSGYRDEIEEYFTSLPEQARKDMMAMFNGDIVVTDSADNAMEGAFTTTIGDDRSLCFFGPGYSNPMTVIHEVGHYYGSKHTFLNEIPLDLAETQSQGNEWLFMSFLETQMKADFYNAAVTYKTYNDIVTIMLCVIIDEFEEQVYTHPDIANLTSDDLDEIMEDVCENYGGIDYLSNTATDVQSYWRMVVVEQPVYYISYGVSAIAAINVFTIADGDYQQGVDAYCSIIENVDLDKGFLGNIQSAGLDGPFDEEVFKKLQAMTK